MDSVFNHNIQIWQLIIAIKQILLIFVNELTLCILGYFTDKKYFSYGLYKDFLAKEKDLNICFITGCPKSALRGNGHSKRHIETAALP